MRLLLGSGGYRSDERRELLVDAMREHFGGVKRILFVPYAGGDHDGYVATMTERGFHAGYELVGIHRASDPRAAIREAEAVYVGGGNTFRLTRALHELDLLEPIRERVRAGMPFMGVSAGTNVACPTMQTTNDMPICAPPSFETLGLVPFQINAHYYAGSFFLPAGDGAYQEHFGETRDQRIGEFHELNEPPVLGLWEGGHLAVRDGSITLHGAPARLFEKGRDPRDFEPGDSLDFLIR